MAGRPNVSTGALPSTYGVGAWGAQGSSKNYRRPMGKDAGRQNNSARFDHPTGRTTGGNSYAGGLRPGDGNLYPERVRAVRSAGRQRGSGARTRLWEPRHMNLSRFRLRDFWTEIPTIWGEDQKPGGGD